MSPILGRNSSPNEMWPDVIGVSVVFLVSGMFMLGLENAQIFSGLMVGGTIGIICQLLIVSWLKGSLDNFHTPEGEATEQQREIGVAVGCALMCFVFPSERPKKIFGRIVKSRPWNVLLICVGIVLFSVIVTTGCLSSLITDRPQEEFLAVPTFHIMESQGISKIIPAVACMTVLACSGALMELFPEMYKKIVTLTNSDWRILAKQIGFENSDTGSPVLAIFTSGSLCAMLAFACPLENLLYILACGHLASVVFRSLYLLYIPFRPKVVVTSADTNSSLNYSRLDSEAGRAGGETEAPSGSSAMKLSTSLRKLWTMTRNETVPVNFPTKKRRRPRKPRMDHEEMEREWLLLGEPQSPRLDREAKEDPVEIVDTVLIGDEPEVNRMDEDEDGDDSSSCTDIDAIVHEYKEQVRVTTGGPLEGNVLRIPSTSSWRLTMIMICLLMAAVSLLDLGIYQWNLTYGIIGVFGIWGITVTLYFTPRHVNQKQEEYQNMAISVITLCSSMILIVSTLSNSWPALLFWLFSGLALIIRCDLWCCPCLDKTEDVTIIQEPIFGSTHQLYLTETAPTLVIGSNAIPKGHLIATRLPSR